RERIAVVISDPRMPGTLGTDLLAQSLEVSPETVRILLTAFTAADALMASINAANIYHFVLKPWDPKELLHIVGQGVQRYRLGEERERLLRDLARNNADLEAALAELRAAQDHAVREASLRAQLQRYVSPRLVDMAVANPALLEIPGEWRQATVLFADIRGFTRLIETTRAPVMIRLLDEYFNRMIEVIFGHRGTVEQLIGDEIVALFGVPEGAEDAAARAVGAAVDMIDGVQHLARRWTEAGLPAFDIGIGLSSGKVMAGTIGSDRRRRGPGPRRAGGDPGGGVPRRARGGRRGGAGPPARRGHRRHRHRLPDAGHDRRGAAAAKPGARAGGRAHHPHRVHRRRQSHGSDQHRAHLPLRVEALGAERPRAHRPPGRRAPRARPRERAAAGRAGSRLQRRPSRPGRRARAPARLRHADRRSRRPARGDRARTQGARQRHDGP